METLGDQIQEGDVLLSNHPESGGTHLPDLTVITPVSLWSYLDVYVGFKRFIQCESV